MAGALRKTMVYLGLAEDDERYDDVRRLRGLRRASRPGAEQARSAREERSAAVTPLPQRTPGGPAWSATSRSAA